MMPRASFSFAAVTPWPEAVLASSVIRVPPCRSRPSFGFHVPLSATRPYSAPTTSVNTMSRRPGRAAFVATATRSSLAGHAARARCSVLLGRGLHRRGRSPVCLLGPETLSVARRAPGLDHSHHSLPGDLQPRAWRDLENERLVSQRHNRPEDPRAQHDLAADLHARLRTGELLLTLARRTDHQDIEEESDQSEREEGSQVFHEESPCQDWAKIWAGRTSRSGRPSIESNRRRSRPGTTAYKRAARGGSGRPLSALPAGQSSSSKRVGEPATYDEGGVPAGAVRPRCSHAAGVAIRPRGVLARKPLRTRNGSATSSTVSRSSPTATASVLTPTGPPPNRRQSTSRTARSRRSRPDWSTS